jgi:HSP20 family protein
MNTFSRGTFFDVNKFFNGFYQTAPAYQPVTKQADNTFSPKVDIIEQDSDYQLIVELAGISKENVAVSIEESTLTIEASNEQKSTDENSGTLLRRERVLGKFVRSFDLGNSVEHNQIKAVFKDGLLILTIPKVKEEVIEPRQIDIH